MKGKYLKDQDNSNHHYPHHNYNHNNNSNNAHSHHPMFPKFPPPQLFPTHSFPFDPKDSGDAATADAAPQPSSKKLKSSSAPAEDGGTVEVPRRPRGRPPGSKNRPKPPVVITREPEPAMAPYILELPGGCDIIESLTRFTRRRSIGICVLTASGVVADVTLKQPSTVAPGATVTFHGRFDILSLSAICLVQTVPFGGNSLFAFTISLAGPQGQIVGGMVVGPLLSAGTVYIVATSFNSPSFHRLPLDDEEGQNTAAGGDGQSASPVSGESGGGGGGSSGGGQMGLYSCHMGSSSSDVVWAPTVRAPPPPPY